MQPSPHDPSSLKTTDGIAPPNPEFATLSLPPAAPLAQAPTLLTGKALGANGGIPPPGPSSPGSGEEAITLPGYEILGVLGRGGMGIVYKARQVGLNRLVALKMILHADHAGPAERERFQREARALAGLGHPNIVQVYEVGEHQGKPFFSLEYVKGGSLDGYLRLGPLTAQEAAALIESLATAMQAAHDNGIVHRDLKPANVLLAFRDATQKHLSECVAKVTDFGLAKKQDEGNLSMPGAVMGTAEYMAPEQAAGDVRATDGRTDVYALGAILYECLTGRPPFKAATVMDTLMQVIAQEAVPVRHLQPGVPRDLETICLKCLHKEPARRYASAKELGEDLGRFLRSEPVRARPVGRLERGWRWCRRNAVVAGLLTTVVLVLVGGAAVSTWFGFQAQVRARDAQEAEALAQQNAAREREALVQVSAKEQDERRAKEEAQKARVVANDRLYASQLSLAQSYWKEGNVPAALEKLNETWEHRDSWEHRYLYTLMNYLGQRTFRGHAGPVFSVCFSPDGKRIASGSEDRSGRGEVKVWDVATEREILTLKGHTDSVTSVCFSPDGKRLASASGGYDPNTRKSWGEVKVWDAGTGQKVGLRDRWWIGPDYHWHTEQARQTWQAGDWFAAAFHLGRLLPSRPWDADLHLRRAYALARLGQSAPAARHYVQAILLNPRVHQPPVPPDPLRMPRVPDDD